MKYHLWIGLFLLAGAVGCRPIAQPPAPVYQPVPPNSFVKQWQADVAARDPVKAIYLREGAVLAYTQNNQALWLSASGGELRAARQVATRGHTLYPPVSLTDFTVVPTTVSIEAFNKAGKHLNSFPMPTSVQGPGTGTGDSIVLGVSHTGSGRLALFRVGNDKVSMTWELFTSEGVVAAPAIFQNTIFAAGLTGQVWAVSLTRQAIWLLPENTFRTDGAVTADLAANDFGVFVASQDKKLYCLDRNTGKIKWSYYSGMPLVDSPVVLGDVVYQIVPERGLAAIKINEGDYSRKPLWVQPQANQVLAADQKYIYVRSGRSTILALDKATGEPKFRSTRDDLTVFATNTETPMIYAATKGGAILAIRPVLKPGTVGEIVLAQ